MGSEVQLSAASAYLSSALLERGLLSRLVRRLLRLVIGCLDKVSCRNALLMHLVASSSCQLFELRKSHRLPSSLFLEIDHTRENYRIVDGLSEYNVKVSMILCYRRCRCASCLWPSHFAEESSRQATDDICLLLTGQIYKTAAILCERRVFACQFWNSRLHQLE
ncbi:hypothetical protein METSCH_D00120 [Metschnikowia aff. pulcherrima]|uniref:Uncharacterized protein n=1 Tax=Metschnikowia aff. pulcherrima TaxID=2163413 RepID=A0A4P6XQH2_9ASCO|nr:hypothetical protein METSCH_D00120 [Metschnikowia aff. pulcherrima]